MSALFRQHNVRCGGGWAPSSPQQFSVLQHKVSFECAATEPASCVDLLDCLGGGSVNRLVFDLDGVCRVGELIPAPADVLKGGAGQRLGQWWTHTHTHCASMAAETHRRFILHPHSPKTKQTDQTQTNTWMISHTQAFLFCWWDHCC